MIPDDAQPLPRFEIRPLTPEEGGGYMVEFPDFPGCIADGDTPEAAILEGKDALRSYIETHRALGRSPNPAAERFAGQWRQRAPKSLHAALARRAANEGVSLNTLVLTMLAEGLGRRSANDPR